MPVYRIGQELRFPHPSLAHGSGVLGVGGDLSARRLILAYRHGIFPWFDEPPVLWWSPDPRMVLPVQELRVPRSTRKHLRRGTYEISADRAFEQVIDACAKVPRPGQSGTWLGEEMRRAYLQLHEMGYAHSTEAWKDGELVGGLYGVAVGRLYAGESMFARADDASKVAFSLLVAQLKRWEMPLVDCQVHTDHLARFGAREISRESYLASIRPLTSAPDRLGPWSLDPDLVADLIG